MYLMMSGIAGTSISRVESALRGFAEQNAGSLTPVSSDIESGEIMLIAQSEQGNVTVLYPDSFLGWHAASVHLSKVLDRPVLSLHVHDGDFWMYVLLENDREIDRFNPLPDYWEEIAEEAETWAGNADVFANHWPNVKPSQISNYLVRWDDIEEITDKAYSDDEFGIGQDWQITDFMKKIGLIYPIDDDGGSIGMKYEFKVNI